MRKRPAGSSAVLRCAIRSLRRQHDFMPAHGVSVIALQSDKHDAFMLSADTSSASAMVGTAVFRIVVSSASMKKATATSHGNSRLPESPGNGEDAGATDRSHYESNR